MRLAESRVPPTAWAQQLLLVDEARQKPPRDARASEIIDVQNTSARTDQLDGMHEPIVGARGRSIVPGCGTRA
jgi:hypothetical protein